jgi:hypothetical protein
MLEDNDDSQAAVAIVPRRTMRLVRHERVANYAVLENELRLTAECR